MPETSDSLKARTKQFSIEIVAFVRSLPATETNRVLGRQLLRSATAVGANYRAACRSRSRAEFAARMGVVVEEADESAYWLELFAETVNKGPAAPWAQVDGLLSEAKQLIAIFVATRISVQRNAASREPAAR